MEILLTTYTVKNIPPDIYEKLKRSAALNRRSINSEIIFCIENTVQSQAVDSELVLRRARKLRSLTQNSPITDDELKMAKEDGRL
jgi:antitoxin FitA